MNSEEPVSPRWHEADRQAALERYSILDTPREAAFDDIARIAAQICDVPTALITFIDDDRQWMKSAIGSDLTQTTRGDALCNHAIRQADPLIIPDARLDTRFADNPYVTGANGIRFYAGAPLLTPDGLPLGTLCVLDTEPRELGEDQREALLALSRQVVAQLEMRRLLETQRAAEELHRLILESAIDYAIITMDLAGRVTSWNEGARLAFGWTEEEMHGQPCNDFFTAEDCAAGVPDREMGAALTTGRGTDERWHRRKDGSRFWASGEMMPLTDDAGQPVGFLKILRDRTEQREAKKALADHQALLTGELHHRLKNTLSVVQAIVAQSLRGAPTPLDAREAIEGRLAVLGHAHDVLMQTSWSAAPIEAIVDRAISVHDDRRDRVSVAGPPLLCQPRVALALAMALHELSTNALKYGALSTDKGHVDIVWSIGTDGNAFEFSWRETGGPPVTAPVRTGFGTRLMSSLSSDFGGKVETDYNRAGLHWTIRSTRAKIEDVTDFQA